MFIILEILNNDCVTLAYDITNNMTKSTFAISGVALAVAGVSTAISGAVAIGAASKQRSKPAKLVEKKKHWKLK